MSHCIPRIPWLIAGRSDLHIFTKHCPVAIVSRHTLTLTHIVSALSSTALCALLPSFSEAAP